MQQTFHYGKTELSFSVREENIRAVLSPRPAPPGFRGAREVERSLASPIGSPPLCGLARPGMRVAVITSDITRPVPSAVILPPVLAELERCGVPAEDIVVVFALGSHRPHSDAERRMLAGDLVYDRYRCIDMNPEDVAHLGTTSSGTPVDVFREVAEADLRVCVGNIEYHYFVGYSGGMKAIMPGVSTRAAIQKNHSRMTHPEAYAGHLEGNPVRGDIDEVAKLCPADFIVNVVLDENKEITACFSGHYREAHRQGCAYLDSIYKFEIEREEPLVVVSAGGFPKDINMYQAQKALDNARQAVRQDGIIIWAARCGEGFGEGKFERWMTTIPTPEEMIGRIEENFELGGHKAAAIAMTLQKARVFLISDMDPALVRRLHMEPFTDMQSALDAAYARLGEDAGTILMPYGGSTLPVIKK